MTELSAARGHWVSISIILLTISLDVALKATPDLQELMWACYWASAAIVIGTLLASESIVASGILFFLSIGFPAWIVGLFMGRPADPTSVLMHTVPVISGAFYVPQLHTLSYRTCWMAWLLYVAPALLAWRFCTPNRHINLVHWIWPPLEGIFRSDVAFQIFLFGLTAATPYLVLGVLKRYRSPVPSQAGMPT